MKLDANIIIATSNDLARQHFPDYTEQMERLAWHVGLLNGRIRELVAIINDKEDTIEQIKAEIDSILADHDKKRHLELVK